MANKLKKWTTHEFSTDSYAGKDYLKFQREARTDLRKQAEAAGYRLFEFNKNHYCFSAVLQDEKTGNFVYVTVNDVRYSSHWYSEILYRTMEHEKDWIGGPNHSCPWDELTEALLNMKKIRKAS